LFFESYHENSFFATIEGGRKKWEPIWGKFHISNRLGEMSEVAGAAAFLCSKDALFVNGKFQSIFFLLKFEIMKS